MTDVDREFLRLRERVFDAHPARGGSAAAFRAALAALDTFRFWHYELPLAGCECGCLRPRPRHARTGRLRRFATWACSMRGWRQREAGRLNAERREARRLRLVVSA